MSYFEDPHSKENKPNTIKSIQLDPFLVQANDNNQNIFEPLENSETKTILADLGKVCSYLTEVSSILDNM